MTETMKPGEWGTRDGKPAIVWHRPGMAATGEPPVVQETRTYANEEERFDAHQRTLDCSVENSGLTTARKMVLNYQQKAALNLLTQALSVATETGLFDVLSDDVSHPDVINKFCDEVSELAERANLTNANQVRPRD